MLEKVIFLGAGGHCKNILSFFLDLGQYEVYGVTDPFCSDAEIRGVPVIGSDEVLKDIFINEKVRKAFITVGSIGDNRLRTQLFNQARSIGYQMINIYHPQSIVSDDLKIGVGNLFLAGCIINGSVSIGNNNIVNTGAIIEHDVTIGSHTHIAPGAILGGGVGVGDGSHIGIGATVIQGVKIGINSTVGAGAVVLNDVPDDSVVVGIPAQLIKSKN